MLLQRVMTALILLPVALFGFFGLEGWAFELFIGVVITLGAWEWARLAGVSAQMGRVLFALGVALILLLLHGLQSASPSLAGVPLSAAMVLVLALCWWLVASALVMTFPNSARVWKVPAVALLLGVLVLVPAWQGLALLKQWPQANWLILSVMVLVWAADIGAYFAGKAFGRRKLAPRVSPGKSWEGFWGGMAFSLLLLLVVGLYRQWPATQLVSALLGAAVVVAMSVMGDLNESMFKRHAGIKDSSNLLPGHGGVMDRIDSLTAAVPLFTLLLWLAGPQVW